MSRTTYPSLKSDRTQDKLLEGQIVRLRPVLPQDLPQLMVWDDNEEIYRWAGKKFSSGREAEEWYLGTSSNQRKTFAIETLSESLVGEIEILNISWRLHTAELRVFIGERSLWNQGLGTDAVETCLKWVFTRTSLRSVFLRVDSQNERAKRCYRKAGFVPKGKVRIDPDGDSQQGPVTLILMEISKDKAFA